MRIRLAIPDRLVTPEALEAALEATTLANAEAISRGEVPTITDAIRRGVKWQPEPYLDGEHFDLSHEVAQRGWGDCDDLAPWLAGELRASGEDEGARPRVYQTGPERWHVVVETSDGEILDPSKWAGMGKRSGPSPRGVVGQIAKPFARRGHGALTVLPHSGAWWSRVDLPWPDGVSGHIASHARASTPEQALNRALCGAISCGNQIDSPLTDRALACGELLLSDASEVGSIFDAFGKVLKGAASAATDFIPGGGLAKSALSMLTKGGRKRPKGGIQHPNGAVSVPLEEDRPEHGQHMFLSYHPTHAPGPVVMRF